MVNSRNIFAFVEYRFRSSWKS